MVASSRSAVCGWSPMPTFPGASRCAGSCCTDSAISWRNSATIVPKCGCPTLLATPAHYPNSPNWPVPAGFLTQKISWNQVDKFPHHSFWWEGIDGTRIFTHFPPADTYGSDLSAHDLEHARANFQDKGRSNSSLVPFGYGDGGGGPTREMLAQARRVADLDGSPKLAIEPPATFFSRAESEHEDPGTWVGELYLELHRGTFTSQYEVKKRGTVATNTCCVTPSCGAPLQPYAAHGLSRGAPGRDLADDLPVSVPRHLARVSHRVGVPRGRRRSPSYLRRINRIHSPRPRATGWEGGRRDRL
ncbi:alpha-mannosidase [Cutibacterium acnes JCM 18918]|nr:alpha-mannosidase [Cutibacterium acnes JCM 18918]